MSDEDEPEMSVRGNPAITAQFFYVMRGLMAATACQERLDQARTLDDRREAGRQGREALSALRDSLEEITVLLSERDLSPEMRSMFAETLATQQRAFESANSRFEATLRTYGLAL